MELKHGLACRRLEFRWQAGVPSLLSSVEATFPPGSVTLITGDTGAGKSTLLHILASLLRPTAGEVWADGKPVSRWSPHHRDRWRKQMGIVFQHLALVADLTAAENLLVPLIPKSLAFKKMQKKIQGVLEALDLSGLAQTKTMALSGGQQQRLAVARALVTRPRFLFVDEPTAFQDDRHTRQIETLLHDAAGDGAVVVIGSHDPRLRSSNANQRRFRLASGTLSPVQAEQGQDPS